MPKQKPTVKAFSWEGFQHDMLHPVSNSVGNLFRRMFGLKPGWLKNRDIIKNNYELGRMHFARGNIGDASFRFNLVVFFDKTHADAWDYLGRSQLAEGKQEAAINSLKTTLELKPNNPEASYLLAVALGKKAPEKMLPTAMPRALVVEHFDLLAPTYTAEQLENYQYQGHVMLARAIREHVNTDRIDYNVLDLGTGSGLCGVELRDIAGHLTGVDASPRMLDEARKLVDAKGNKIFNELVHRDAQAFLEGAPADFYDIIAAGGLLSYIGDVQDVLRFAAIDLKPGGIFAFTADIWDGAGNRFLPEAGRFGFSESYLRDLATANGLQPLVVAKAEIYPAYHAWLCVFKK